MKTPAVAFLALALSGCTVLGPDAPADDEVLDGPIPTLTAGQVRLHILGDEEFGRRFSASDGLGPVFVATSCDQCHVGDGKGHPTFSLTRFGRQVGDDFDPLLALGGPQLQHRAIPGHVAETVPAEATGITQLMPPAVTGLGYLDAVADTTLIRLADPFDEDGDGISGRLQLVDDTEVVNAVLELEGLTPGEHGTVIEGRRIGRFGKKANAVNLLQQTVGAYLQDMGITSDLLSEDLFNPVEGSRTSDAAPDPEVSSSVVSNVVFYLKTLRFPDRREADAPDVVAGEQAFADVGCAGCHVPTLRTGHSDIAALDRVEFHPYTDLLLHDMGAGLDDGYTEGSTAMTAEWRTPPLWGISLQARFQGGQAFYLHDGRAQTLREAIELHGGEAASSRDRYLALPANVQEQLLRFLRSL